MSFTLTVALISGVALLASASGPRDNPDFFCEFVSTTIAPEACGIFVDVVTSVVSSDLVITLPAVTTTATTTTTTSSPVSTSCFSSGTTLSPTTVFHSQRAPESTLRTASVTPAAKIRQASDCQVIVGGIDITTAITETFFNVFNPFTCTAVVQSFSATTTTETAIVTEYSLTTTQATETATVTDTVIQPIPSAYDGLNYYQYFNDYYYDGASTQGNGLGGGGYKTSDWRGNFGYNANGKQNPIYFVSPDYPNGGNTCELSDQTSYTDCSQWTVVLQGYFFAKQTGNYTFSTNSAVDNELVVWGGDKSYRSYTDSNFDLVFYQPGDPNSHVYNLTTGQLYPLTMIVSNGGGPMRLYLGVTAPDGEDLTSSPDVFVAPCDVSAFIP